MTKFRFDKVRVTCTGCGAEIRAACTCGMAYEILAEKREGDRQRAYRARKHERKQQPRHVTSDNDDWTDAEIIEETSPEDVKTRPIEPRWTEEEYAASIVRDVFGFLSGWFEGRPFPAGGFRRLISGAPNFQLTPPRPPPA